MLENKMPGTQFKNIHGCSYMLTYEEEPKTKEPKLMNSHYFCWECAHRGTGTTKVKKGSKEAVYVICMHLVCLCTSVKETPVNSSPCFIANRHQDHHMLVSWRHTSQASLPCLYLALSSSLIFPSCTTVCLYWVTANNMNPIQRSFCFGFSECMCMCTVHAYAIHWQNLNS